MGPVDVGPGADFLRCSGEYRAGAIAVTLIRTASIRTPVPAFRTLRLTMDFRRGQRNITVTAGSESGCRSLPRFLVLLHCGDRPGVWRKGGVGSHKGVPQGAMWPKRYESDPGLPALGEKLTTCLR